MAQDKELSAISLNLLYAMDGEVFVSETLGCVVEIRGGCLVTDIDDAIRLNDSLVESLHEEFVWNNARRN